MKYSNFPFLSLILIIILLSLNIDRIESKIPRKHEHPGSGHSSRSDIEIEPLNKNDLNDKSNNIDEAQNNKIEDSQKNNQETIVRLDDHKVISGDGNANSKYFREDDEFVYEREAPQNNVINDDSLINLDQTLQQRQEEELKAKNIPYNNNITKNINPNIKPNINPNMNFTPPHLDPQKERFLRDQAKRHSNPYNPRPHQQRVINQDNLNHGRYPNGPNSQGPNPNTHIPTNQGETQTTNNQPSKARKMLSLFYQIMMIFFFVSFVYNYFLGKNQNDKHALVWYQSNKEYFEERYEYFGIDDDDNLKKPKKNTISLIKDCKLIKENPYYYKLTCANYRCIHYLTVVLEFHKRYDMTALLSSIFISPKDRIVFQVSFEPLEKVGWIFCVSKKKQSKSLKKSYEDINYFCQLYEPSSFNNYMCLLSESLEMFMELFNNKDLFKYYKLVEQYLEAIYYSDMISAYAEGNNVFFSFSIDLTRPNQERNLLEITHFVNLFVDTLAQLKYSKEVKDKFKKNRIMFERTKMDSKKRKEIEEKEKRDLIERWKLIKKIKTKKGADKRKLIRQLNEMSKEE